MELFEVMRTTAAVREFTADPLPDGVVERILDAARFAPTGGNRQGVRVVVVRDRATRERLAELTIPGAQRAIAQLCNGESPWNPLRPCGVPREQMQEIQVPPEDVALYLRAPLVLVVCLDLNAVAATDQDLDRVGVISGASVYPFVWNILLSARNEGYGGTITTLVVAEEPRVKQLLGVPESFAIAAVLPLGKPVRQLTKLKRNSVAEIATRERFDGEPFTPADGAEA
ncbi:nitroreductase family protein [Nocardia transvalensis]|uniref:nitroreductase family protein n=1 Tax=Nocardia transvalensis TaxID=37333 RepID=UPI001895F42D|nr:nitroreductase family protein [Nocardia transvalensis]MBF6328082.1 nitroreductase family protein [Nocardia transvalensis]